MKRITIACLTFAACGLFTLTACSKTDEQTKPAAAKATVSAKMPKLIDLGAHKCQACQKLFPILEELTNEYKGQLQVEFIDVWQSENRKKAEAYGIRLIPTQIFLDPEGKELWRHEGFISKDDILNKWKELGYNFKAPQKEQKSTSDK